MTLATYREQLCARPIKFLWWWPEHVPISGCGEHRPNYSLMRNSRGITRTLANFYEKWLNSMQHVVGALASNGAKVPAATFIFSHFLPQF